MIDIGVNLNSIIKLENINDFSLELQTANISSVVAISSNLTEANELVSISKQYPHSPIHYTIGCHPHHASEWDRDSKQATLNLINNSSPIAIGETGLDFNRNYSTIEEQIFAFNEQILIAQEKDLPLYLHEREAEDVLINTLSNHIPTKGVIHCFTGNTRTLTRYLDLNLYIGVTGWLCDERRGQDLQEAVKYIPNDRLLIETDSPYLIPRTIRPRPKKNHPKYLPYIIAALASIRGQSEEEIKAITTANAQKLFTIK
ncbi:TatD family hydrolase [Marinomonas sp. 15G1-11]|uniref:TatD family hydrolase n=1 Tax=Marinomonas phaeophyticola TaxID=3004091 RepID=A0ABT4JPZ5_9GAMM|nr:TatD family hydrolase [Marinomonas sp. 15G1-11]MCZ2720300.1 TatD family hydrolase [Marinomonas sp. 15G1-11]